MTALLATVTLAIGAALFQDGPPPVQYEGVLSFYAQRPTLGTLQYQQDLGRLPSPLGAEIQTLLAVPNCGMVGYLAVLEAPQGRFYRGIVFDCGGGSDGGHNWMLDAGIAAETDYNFAVAHPDAFGVPARVTILGHWSWGWGYPDYVEYVDYQGVWHE